MTLHHVTLTTGHTRVSPRSEVSAATRGIDGSALCSVAQPDSLPWLAVALQPEAACYPDALEWLGDMERCVAWAWIEAQR